MAFPLQKANEIEIATAWERYKNADSRRKDLEAQKRAKIDTKVLIGSFIFGLVL